MSENKTLETVGRNMSGVGTTFSGKPTFTLWHRIFRVVWSICWYLFASWTPAPMHRWRIFLLRAFGAKVAWNAFIYGSVKVWYPPNLTMLKQATLGPGVDCYSMGRITIGERAIVSQRSYLCTGTHEFHDSSFQIYAKPIVIGDRAWVCAESFVGPGVTVAEGAVLAARGVSFGNLDEWCIYKGNPAMKVGERKKVDYD